MNNRSKIICLMGPTASGKTKLAIELAQKTRCEIISVDSALVYRGMDIGTAKPTAAEQALAPHHLIDIADPANSYSAGQFCEDAAHEIEKLLAKNKIPLLVGGTMLYFHVLQHGFSELPKANKSLRQKILDKADQLGWPKLHAQLQEIDPLLAAQIHPHDSQRIQRALEVYQITGQPLSALQLAKQSHSAKYQVINFVVSPNSRAILHERIALRFQQMLDRGFVTEVENLRSRNDLHADLPAIRTVGYRQAWEYLDGKYDFETMKERAIIATRQFAKRQFTWLRRWQDAIWLNSDSTENFSIIHRLIEG